MNNNKMKLVYWLGFILCGGISCWATAESLCLLSNWHLILCYMVAIAFFIIASFGVKLVVDSFGRFVNHPVLQLLGGTILVLIFWLVCSMPTNTHTFFMSSQGKELITQDITTTEKYLTNIQNYSGDVNSEFEIEKQKILNTAEKFKAALYAEICGKGNPGNGQRTKEIINEFNNDYGYNIKVNSKFSRTETQQAYDEYERQINADTENLILDKQREIIGQSNGETAQKVKDEAAKYIKSLNKIKDSLADDDMSTTNLKDLNNINKELTGAYSLIKANADKAALAPLDKAKYTADNIQTDTKRLTSIYEMVGDWWGGKYKGFGLGWWILVAVLVDIAAFIFFYLATK